MADYSTSRIASYVLTIVVHVSNIVYMTLNARPLKQDPSLKNFLRFQPRYFTSWNFGLQVIYATIALFCEVLLLWNSRKKGYKLNKHLKGLRDILFASIIWPSAMLVCSVFWSLYLLDRELIFPLWVDKVLTPLSNHVIHTLIVPIVICEVFLRPRAPVKSHKRNLFHLLVHLIVYFCVLVYTYKQAGTWIYPIFDKIYGTLYFPIAMLSLVLICIGYYYLQWVLTWLIWGKKPIKKNK